MNHGCTTFSLVENSHLIFARNLDVDYEPGIIFINPRDISKTAYFSKKSNETPVKWISKYGSITFNQISRDIPHGGMNDEGLVVEHLFLKESCYPKKDSRPSLISHQWTQYVLDNCRSVEEAIEIEKKVRISDIEYKFPIHFHLMDGAGDRAIFEFIDGETFIYHYENYILPVLANNSYQESLYYLTDKSKNNYDGTVPEFATESLDRFLKVSDQIKKYSHSDNVNMIDYCFSTLDLVRNSTMWQIVYDISNMEIHYRTKSNANLRKISFNNLNFSSSEILTISIQDDPAKKWRKFSKKINSELINGICNASEFFNKNFGEEKEEIAAY